jgi:sensor histidine kinase YesM
MRRILKKRCHFGYHISELVGIIGLALLITIIFFHNYDQGIREFLLSYTWAVAICATQWLGNSRIYRMLDNKYSWEEHLLKRAIYGSLAIVAYSATAYLLVQIIMFKLVVGALPENPFSWGLRSSYVAILISFFVSLIFVAVGFFQNWKKSLLEAEQFKAEMLMYKYEALQNQINPHFLFNSFNVLSDLVYEDQNKAVDFIRQLSQLFRYVLDSRDKELVPIKEELDFIKAYSYLLQTRFEEKLSIQVDLEVRENEMIVPMTLQLLIENCVKHNEISVSQPLHVQILRKGDYLRVENTLQPLAEGIDSKKTGLSNIRQQFRYFTDKKILITQTNNVFAVEVPILKLGR